MKRVTLKVNIDETGKASNLNEVYENYLLMNSSPKIRQKVELLRMNSNFQKKVEHLRKKWSRFIKEFNYCIEKIGDLIPIESIVKFDKKNGENRANISPIPPPTQEDKDVVKKLGLGEKIQKIILDSKFDQDMIGLAKEEKLYPLEYWKESVKTYVLMGIMSPITYSLKIGLASYFPKNEIFKVPPDLNFAIKIIENKKTKEPELFIHIFENTVLRDIEKNWGLISECREKLQEFKKINETEKRFYPLKNLPVAKELRNKDRKKYHIYHDIVSGELEKIKMTDKSKALEIYNNIPFSKEAELKAANKIKQIRYQFKKRLNH